MPSCLVHRGDRPRPGGSPTGLQRSRLLVFLTFVASLVAAAGSPGAQTGPYAYLRVTPDPRLCPSPACGGFQLEAVGQPSTTCADGSQQPSCYVATADFGALEQPPDHASASPIVRGLISAHAYPGFGNLGRLVVESAWSRVGSSSAAETSYRVRDTGIVCVTHPCLSMEARVLNEATTLSISRLDLSAIGATPEQRAAAGEALQRGDLLVDGTTAPDPGPAGEGLALIATGLWLPEPGHPRCLSDGECPTGSRCNADEVCLPPPGCEPGDVCPAVCSGYCVSGACTTDADCAPSRYCAVGGQCLADGACQLEVDCNLSGNAYPHIECVGHGICEAKGAGEGSCGWACTHPLCVDLLGYDFGPCDAVLGVGVIAGECGEISGCEADPFVLFTSMEECLASCATPPELPALGLPAILGIGLGLGASGLAITWRRRRAAHDPRRGA